VSTLGELVRERRQALSKTQVDLADASGIPQGTISRIERGDYKEIPPPELLNPIADALGMSTAPFLAAAGFAIEAAAQTTSPEVQALCDRIARIRLNDDRVGVLESILDRFIRLDRKASEAVGDPATPEHGTAINGR
jgi:transcriptional regulator with XRE-family HTH domain